MRAFIVRSNKTTTTIKSNNFAYDEALNVMKHRIPNVKILFINAKPFSFAFIRLDIWRRRVL